MVKVALLVASMMAAFIDCSRGQTTDQRPWQPKSAMRTGEGRQRGGGAQTGEERPLEAQVSGGLGHVHGSGPARRFHDGASAFLSSTATPPLRDVTYSVRPFSVWRVCTLKEPGPFWFMWIFYRHAQPHAMGSVTRFLTEFARIDMCISAGRGVLHQKSGHELRPGPLGAGPFAARVPVQSGRRPTSHQTLLLTASFPS